MRVYIGGISAETNSFSPIHMTRETFKQAVWLEGEDMEQIKSTSKEAAGTYRCLETMEDVEIIPGFLAWGQTTGMVVAEEYHAMKELQLEHLKAALPVDAVVLNMHGALQSEDCFDCEGDLFAAVRELVGPDAVITASFDLHASVTPKMVSCLDGASAFRTYPHTDHADTGYRAAEAAVTLVREKVKPRKLYKTLPMIMAVENCNTDEGPVVYAMDRMKALLARPEVLSGALTLTQPWLDVPVSGCQFTVFVRPEADAAPIEAEMDAILKYLWESRDEFYVDIPAMDEAMSQSADCKVPVHIVELGDIVSAGGCGDSTVGLRALLRDKTKRPACVTICDIDTARLAHQLGVGAWGDFMIGAEGEEEYHKRTPVHAQVVRFNSDRVMPTGTVEQGVPMDLGCRVLLRTDDGLYIIVCENPCTNHDAAMMRTMGVQPEEMMIIMQKTHQMFKGGYQGVIGSFLYADTPGYSDRNIPRMPFKNVQRPMYPLDPPTAIKIS